MHRHATHRTVIAAFALVSYAGVASAQLTSPSPPAVTPAEMTAESASNQAIRVLVARSTKLNRIGWLEVSTTYRPGVGLTYTVLREGGDKRIRSRVLRQVLDTEVKMSTPPQSKRIAFSDDNYRIVGDAGGRTLRLAPRRNETALIDGTAQLDLRGRLQQVEGRLAKSPSFWVRSVTIRRTYQAVGGHALPVRVESVADVKLAGRCEFSMWIDYIAVDGLQVDQVATRPTLSESEASHLLIALN
jgi:uncharacterized protein YebE (UPF0316 family)